MYVVLIIIIKDLYKASYCTIPFTADFFISQSYMFTVFPEIELGVRSNK